MADTVFACPACHGNITCDEAWAGQQVQCPICQKMITVAKPAGAPPPPAAPTNPLVPVPPSKPKLSLNQNAQQPAQMHQKHIPIRNLAPPPKKKQGPWRMIAEVGGILLVLGVGTYFGWPYAKAWLNPDKEQAKTEVPVSNTPEPAPAPPGPQQAEPGMPMPQAEVPPGPASDGTSAPPTNVVQTGAIVLPTHTLEVAASKPPTGRVNGKITGTEFLPETVRIDAAGPAQALRFVQGDLASPERELLIYLRLKPGEKLSGQKILVNSDMRTRGLPQVMKRWKNNPRYAPTSKSYSSGYAMKLELGTQKDGVIKGKIYVALPDNEKSVVSGNFSAMTSIPAEGVATPTATPPGQAPAATPMGAERMPMPGGEFQNRYTR